MTTIQIRTKDAVKKNAQEILEELGLDLSSAINMFLVQLIKYEGIPFPILTENGMTPEKEQEMLKALVSAKKSKKSYPSIRAAHRAILGE